MLPFAQFALSSHFHLAPYRVILAVLVAMFGFCAETYAKAGTISSPLTDKHMTVKMIEEDSTTIKVDFRVNRTRIEPDYMDNRHALAQIDSMAHVLACDSNITISRLVMHGTASPEGDAAANEELAKNRCKAMAELLRNRLHFGKEVKVTYTSHHVYGTESAPERAMLDKLRKATASVHISIVVEHQRAMPLHATAALLDDTSTAAPATRVAAPELKFRQWQRHWYLKSNIPAWGMLITNIQAEIDCAPHWSVMLPIYYSGFNYFIYRLKLRTFTVLPEARYWLHCDNQGWFGGVHAGISYYNIATKRDHRYQDHDGNTPAVGGGINVGYRMNLSKNERWKLEFSLGAGVYALDYDYFENRHDGLRIERRKRTFVGIDNAAVSICYRFDIGKPKKGGLQ